MNVMLALSLAAVERIDEDHNQIIQTVVNCYSGDDWDDLAGKLKNVYTSLWINKEVSFEERKKTEKI